MPKSASYTKEFGFVLDRDAFTKPMREAFTTANQERERARRMNLWGWRAMPEELKWWREHDRGINLPHGVRYQSGKSGLLGMCEDGVSAEKVCIPGFTGALYPAQSEAMASLLAHKVGLLHARTGSGKGVMIPWLVANLSVKSLVVLPNVQLLDEMTERFRSLCGFVPTRVGGITKAADRKAALPYVTLATIQSAVKMPADELKTFGLAVFDECDKAVTTDDRVALLYALRPEFIYGMTGTLSLNHEDPKVLRMWFGPVTEMLSHNFVPRCRRVHTPFRTHKDLSSERDFTELNNDLCNDSVRNEIIAAEVAALVPKSETLKGIVITNRVEHAAELARLIEERGVKAYTIVGEDDAERRAEAKANAASCPEPCVLVGSTQIIGRGFDLPSLQTAFICYPNRFDANVVQMAGRVLRKFPGKSEATVVDFVDARVPVLFGQARSRLRSMKKEYGDGFRSVEITNYL